MGLGAPAQVTSQISIRLPLGSALVVPVRLNASVSPPGPFRESRYRRSRAAMYMAPPPICTAFPAVSPYSGSVAGVHAPAPFAGEDCWGAAGGTDCPGGGVWARTAASVIAIIILIMVSVSLDKNTYCDEAGPPPRVCGAAQPVSTHVAPRRHRYAGVCSGRSDSRTRTRTGPDAAAPRARVSRRGSRASLSRPGGRGRRVHQLRLCDARSAIADASADRRGTPA